MMQRVIADLGKMVLLAINLNIEDRHRGWGRLSVGACVAWCQRVWSLWCSSLMNRGSVNSCRATYGNLWRRMATYCMAMYCVVVLTACNGCASTSQQPIGVSCHSFTSGRIMSQGISEGQTSMGESRGAQKTRLICILIQTQDELNQLLESQE